MITRERHIRNLWRSSSSSAFFHISGALAWIDMVCGECSLQTQLSLQYRAEQIAVAVVHLAMKMLRSEAPLWDGRHWWQHCNVSAAELEGALHGPRP